MQLGITLGLTRRGGGGVVTPAIITAFGATGWTATYPDPDPTITPETVTVSSPGFAADGSATTNTREVVVTTRTRTPGGTTLTATDVALSDWIYQGDTVAGVTNTSTRQPPLPQMMWTNVEWERVTGSTLRCSLFVFHKHGKGGRPVACVEFTVSDGTTTTSPVRVTEMTLVTGSVSGVPYAEYQADVDVSGLSDGELTRNAVVKPWVGNAFDISTDGRTWPSMDWITVSKAWKGDIAYYAYVDSGATGGSVATDLATAKTTPFPLAADAIAALETANGGTVSRCEVVYKEGQSHVLDGTFNNNVDNIPIRFIGEDTGGVRPIITRPGNSTFTGKRQYWHNIELRNTTGVSIFFRMSTTGAETYQIFDNCTFNANGQSVGRYFNDIGRVFVYNSTSNFPDGGQGADAGKICAMNTVGTTGWGAQIVVNAVGFDNSGTIGSFRLQDASGVTGSTTPNVGSVYAYGKCTGDGSTNNFKLDGYWPGAESYCIAMVSGEQTGSDGDDNSEFHGGAPIVVNFPDTIEDGNVYACTFAGGDFNGPRDNKEGVTDPAFAFDWRVDVTATILRSTIQTADANGASGYTADASRDRNFPQRYRTGWNDVMWYSNRFPVIVGYTSDFGDYLGLNCAAFVDASPGVAFVDDRSITGTNAGGGDYRIEDDSATTNLIANVPRVPASRVRLPYDLDGNLIPLDGTALAGAHTVPVPA